MTESVMVSALLSIPSPDSGVWYLGAFPVRGYALSIILGIALAVWIGERRWRARGGEAGVVMDVAVWAVPFGIIGGRLYHVITTPERFFGADGDPASIVRIWEGGLGIWGAVMLGALGAWIGVRRRGIPLAPFGDAIAPGIAVAQAVGRWGNWFNQELYGRETDLPWAVEIDQADGTVVTYHPAFLYESLWMLLVAAVLVLVDRRLRLGHGQVFALYAGLYALGRLPIELLRIDEANVIFGARVNVWMSILVLASAVIYLVISRRRQPVREAPDQLVGSAAARQESESARDIEEA